MSFLLFTQLNKNVFSFIEHFFCSLRVFFFVVSRSFFFSSTQIFFLLHAKIPQTTKKMKNKPKRTTKTTLTAKKVLQKPKK